jgi:PAS domain S-box-containing protein
MTLFEQLAEGIAVHSLDGRYRYLNPALERLLGKSRGELLGRPLWDVFPDPVLGPFLLAFQRLVETGESQQVEGDYAPLQRWFAGRLYLVHEQVWVHLRDITDVKRLHEAERESRLRAESERARMEALAQEFRHSEERYRNFVSQSADGIWCIETDRPIPIDAPEEVQIHRMIHEGYISECNDAMAHQYGFQRGTDMVGVRLRQLFVSDDPRSVEYFRAFVQSGYRLVNTESHEVDREGRPKVFVNSIQGALEARHLVRAWGVQRDVTEQRLAEEKIRKGEERLRAIVEATSSAIWTADTTGAMTEESASWRAFTGQTWQQMRGTGWLEALHPEDRERFARAWTEAAREQRTYEIEGRLRKADGSWADIVERAVPLHEPDGAIREWVGTTTDITERKAAERALMESEERFRNMADHAPVMLWVTDVQGRCTYLNRQWYEFTGQSSATGLRFGWLGAVHPEDAQAAAAIFEEAHARRAPFHTEYRLRGKDGTYRWAIDSASPRFGEGGEFLGYIGSVIDISERKQVEEQRVRLLHEAQFLATASAALSSSLEPETTLAAVARLAVPELADWCFVDLLQKDGAFQRVEVAHAFPEDAELARQVQRFTLQPSGNPQHPPTQAILQGRPLLIADFSGERLASSAHDAEHARVMLACQPVSFISVPLVARGNTVGVVSFFTSRSGRRYGAADLVLAEELGRRVALSVDNARLYQEAQEAIRVRDEFLSVASHELKTPLTPISLRLQSLAKESEKQPDSPYVNKVRTSVEAGRKQVQKLSSLIGDLLDVSRISAGRLKLEFDTVDCAAIVRDVVTRYEAPATQAGSPLRVELPEQLEGWWDRLRVDQIVTNLLDNAIKYGAGKPIHIHLSADAQRAILTVRDEGIGIEPQKMPRIFERFERAVSERHYGGLGLGLYITKTLVEAMAGSIQVQSQPGQGALFTVELPRRARPPEATGSQA